MKSLKALFFLCGASTIGFPADSVWIDQMAAKLMSDDSNVSRMAVEELHARLNRERNEIVFLLPHRASLEAHLQRWPSNSGDQVALLLGLLGDKQAVTTLRKVRAECAEIERKADPIDPRRNYTPRVQLACLKALLRLRDITAQEEVRTLLRSTRVDDRAKGIECVSWAESTVHVSDVVPLLSDKRNAVNIAPSFHDGYSYYLRVCDLAVYALADLCKLKTSFAVQRAPYGERYCDEKIAEVRRKVLAVSAP